MLNANLIARAAGGQLKTLASPVGFEVPFNGGTPTTGNLQELFIHELPPTNPVSLGGLTYDGSDGALDVNTQGSIFGYVQGGIPVDGAGSVCASFDQPVAFWNAGLPFDANGRLALATPGGVVNLSPFDSGFDSGFSGVPA